jgi:hypothetical protein
MIKKKIVKKVSCPSCGIIQEIKGFSEEKIIIICSNCHKKGYFIFPNEKIKIDIKKIIIQTIPYFLIFLTLLITILIIDFGFFYLLALFILVPIFSYFNFEIYVLIFYAILFLILSVIILIFYGDTNLINQLCLYAYWLLIVGVLCISINYLKKQRKPNV